MEELSKVIADMIKKYHNERMLMGDNRFITHQGRTVDVVYEYEQNKKKINSIINDYATIEWVSGEIQKLKDDYGPRITALENDTSTDDRITNDIEPRITTLEETVEGMSNHETRITTLENDSSGVDNPARRRITINEINVMKNTLEDLIFRNNATQDTLYGIPNTFQDDSSIDYNKSTAIEYDPTLKVVKPATNEDSEISATYKDTITLTYDYPAAGGDNYSNVAYCTDDNGRTFYWGGGYENNLANMYYIQNGIGYTYGISGTYKPPSDVQGMGMVYIPDINSIYITGGYKSGSYQSYNILFNLDTKEFSNISFTGDTIDLSRGYMALTYDRVNKKIIYAGGYNGTYKHDTFLIDINTWTVEDISTAGMIFGIKPALWYDQNLNASFIFGGGGDNTVYSNKIFKLNYSIKQWEEILPSVKPVARSHMGVTYDKRIGAIIVGGYNYPTNTPFKDVWLFDGNDFIQLNDGTANPTNYANYASPMTFIDIIDGVDYLCYGKTYYTKDSLFRYTMTMGSTQVESKAQLFPLTDLENTTRFIVTLKENIVNESIKPYISFNGGGAWYVVTPETEIITDPATTGGTVLLYFIIPKGAELVAWGINFDTDPIE